MVVWNKKNRRHLRNARRAAKRAKARNTYRKRKNFSAKRGPLVETKKNPDGPSNTKIPDDSPALFIAVSSFMKMYKGIEIDQFLGKDIFSKYISMKLNFRFPQGEFGIVKNYRLQLIHGWMVAPFALDNYVAPKKAEANIIDLETIITNRIQPAFNQAADRMTFRDKEKRIYKIEGKQWIRPNRNNQINHPQDASVLVEGSTATEYQLGGPPDVFKQIHWKPMRKVRYTYTANVGGTPSPPLPFYYPNEAWIPFVVIYAPDYANVGKIGDDDYKVSLDVSNCHWYTDS